MATLASNSFYSTNMIKKIVNKKEVSDLTNNTAKLMKLKFNENQKY